MKKYKEREKEKLILDFKETGKTLEFNGINAIILRKLFYEGSLEWLTAVNLRSKYKKIKKRKILHIKVYPNAI